MNLRCPSDSRRTSCRISVAGPVFLCVLAQRLDVQVEVAGKEGLDCSFASGSSPLWYFRGDTNVRYGWLTGRTILTDDKDAKATSYTNLHWLILVY
jgi:hypothetical protein